MPADTPDDAPRDATPAEAWLWCNLARPAVVETLEAAGARHIVLDLQHGEAELADVVACLRAARRARLIIRLPHNAHADLVGRLLDSGAPDLMFPQIETAAEATALVALTRYPPDGARGVAGLIRANAYGADAAYFTDKARAPRLFMQIETMTAVDDAAAIARVDGVSGLFVGTSDLAASAGHIGKPASDVVLGALTEIRERVGADAMLGAFCGASRVLREHCRALGYQALVVGSDTQILRDGAKTALPSSEA